MIGRITRPQDNFYTQMRLATTILLVLLSFRSLAQYAPQAGLPGSTALPANSPVFKAWAQQAVVTRGYINLADTNFSINGNNHASYGQIANIYGPADGQVISLGDRGEATIILDYPLYDGPGYDFAVFENGFASLSESSMAFLELAFVSVSSDGKHFFTFPAVSLTQDTNQIGPFDMLQASKLHNLAGKYIAGYGVPFDLADLSQYSTQGLDLENIRFIRITDVCGSINPLLASYDSQGNIINDPFPTPYPTSGFDLDAVGLINIKQNPPVKIYPNPSNGQIFVQSTQIVKKLIIKDLQGRTVFEKSYNVKFFKIFLSNLKSGLYFCLVKGDNFTSTVELILL